LLLSDPLGSEACKRIKRSLHPIRMPAIQKRSKNERDGVLVGILFPSAAG